MPSHPGGSAITSADPSSPEHLKPVADLGLSADTFRLLVDSVEDYAILMLDPDGRVLTWNRGARRIMGYSAREILGRHFSEFYPADDVRNGKPPHELLTALREGRAEDEGWRVRKDGSQFWASVALTALRSETGVHLGFATVTCDLTERRAAADRLRRSEERSRLLIEGVSDYAIYMLDPQGHVDTWNTGATLIKGYEPSEIIGRHYSKFFTPEDIAAGRPEHELEAARVSGRFEEEGWRVRKDGTRFWASVVLTSLRDESGNTVGFAKITRDLSSRKLAEDTAKELLREQTARTAAEAAERRIAEERERYKALSRRLEVIFQGIGDGITVQEPSGRVIFANQAAAVLCGFSTVDEFLNTPVAETVARFEMFDEHGNPFEVQSLPARRVFAGEDAAAVTMRVRDRASGRQWWTVIRANPVRNDEGTTELAVNIWRDVTADRRREEHERYISEATRTLASSLDYQTNIRALANLLVPNLADWCSVNLLDGDALRNVAVAHVDPARIEEAQEYTTRYPPNLNAERGVWNVVRTGQSEITREISDELLQAVARDEQHLRLLRGVGMKSVVSVAIRSHDQVIGTISLISAESGRRYDQLDVTLAEELGRRAGMAIENAKLYAAEKKGREQIELIARAGELFSETLEYEATLRNIVAVVLPTLGDFAYFDVVEGDDVRRIAQAYDDPEVDALIKQTTFVRSTRQDKNPCALSSGAVGFHPQIDEAWHKDVATSPEHLELLRRLALGSMITVPVVSRGVLLGALTVCFGKSRRRHVSEDVRLAEEIAGRGAIALLQARLFAEARVAAEKASRAARLAEEASRVKDEFLATVSHELRTPLNAIVGWSSLLKKSNDDAAIAKGIDIIHRNAQAQAKLIEDILDVSRIVTGKLRLEPQQTDLTLVILDAMEVVRPSAVAKRISLEFVPPSSAAVLLADAERLQQVIWNLLSNAVKFTDLDGSIRIGIAEENSEFVISVADTGRGIESEFLPYVFDRFKQADGSTTRRIGGLGLGLAIVRHIVELHGGSVRATSPGPGGGATFLVRLPIRSPQRASLSLLSEARPNAMHRNDPKLEGLRILVVDDEADARELLRTVLEAAGGLVDVASSSEEAFEHVQRFHPLVLVSDIGMPGEDGLSMMRRIRALDDDCGGRIPAVALTAYARSEDKLQALAAGFTTYLSKPVAPDEILAAVSNLAKLVPRD